MTYREKYNEWLSFDEETKKELLSVTDEKEIEDRFYKDLAFGTGGLRGIMGAGSNRMNKYTVGKATFGLANYIKSKGEKEMSVVLAYDSRNNSAYFGRGMSLVKYTGARGKSGASEAPAEFVAELRNIFEEVGARYQACELGKVDKGGGGTIALTLANRGMDVVDVGVPVMGMHSPYEITSKFDVYQAFKGYKAFLNK